MVHLVHLLSLLLFAALACVLLLSRFDDDVDLAGLGLYAAAVGSVVSNLHGDCASWVTERLMHLARFESFAMGASLAAVYWILMGVSALCALALTGFFAYEGTRTALRSLRCLAPPRALGGAPQLRRSR